MADLDYCFDNMPVFQQIQCARWLHGGINGIIVALTDAGITDWSSASQINAKVASGDAFILRNIQGEFPDGTANESENPIGGISETQLDSVSYVLNVLDFNVNATNDAAYAAINGGVFHVAFNVRNENQMLVVQVPVSVVALQANVPKSMKEKQRYNTVYKWEADRDWYPTRVTTPSGIF